MKKLLLGTVAAAAVVVSPALAADLPTKAPILKAPPVVAVFNWTGCYIGAYGGGAWGGDVDTHDPRSQGGAFPAGTFYNAPTANTVNGGAFSVDLRSSAIAGGTLGCNWQAPGSAFVWGIEGEGGYLRLRSKNVIDPFSVNANNDTHFDVRVGDWYAVAAGRLGFAVDRTLFYAKGGVGFTEVKASFLDNCTTGGCGLGTLRTDGSKDRAFWVAGGGIEYAFDYNWSVKAEYLFLGLDHTFSTCGPAGGTFTGSTFCSDVKVDGIHTAKIGINYRWGAGPVRARY